ncbi:Krr1-domain-containing protein [Dacryopinax primogenitus]|uniref:Krr1-domain-containing protein n=1 Tax=Dacryopinax primogenitus (strain DJM 731) TaxID=1858805 RepID=M5FQF2_DACPD|nr:Krr1-domain-containing protein [Dacryopinax primogenitus]EJT96944.1 Krr1-domain-containing protein [Dacryopinax primogenitus]
MDLFDDDETHKITINQHFAAAYAAKKEREELSILEEKYGSESQNDDDDDESEEDEDEYGDDITPAMDAAIFKTLSRIRRKDPIIYNQEKDVFQEEARRLASDLGGNRFPKKPSKETSKPVTLRDMTVQELLHPDQEESVVPTHAEEQATLRKETISAFKTAAVDDDVELLTLRNPANEMNDESYRRFLLDSVGETDMRTVLSSDVEETPKLADFRMPVGVAQEKHVRKRKRTGILDTPADEEFLLKYILNRGWIDRSEQRHPTLEEITAKPVEAVMQEKITEEDSDFEDITDQFESSYNFRFEEPHAAVITAHPRSIQSTVRRQDDSRKLQREKRRRRKAEEKLVKQEELKRLKALKRKEIEEKLKILGHVSGKHDIRTDELDLEGDFDPEAHDAQMRAVFDEEIYDDQHEQSKPTWDDEVDITNLLLKEAEKTERRQNKSKETNQTADVVDAPHAATSLDLRRKVDEYMDEYLGLDYNGMVGDQPTRFKYMEVPVTSFGLTPTDILLADDAELNTYMGMTKYAPYHPNPTDKRGKRYWQLKEALKGRSWSRDTKDEPKANSMTKRKGKKERARSRASNDVNVVQRSDCQDERLAKRQKTA